MTEKVPRGRVVKSPAKRPVCRRNTKGGKKKEKKEKKRKEEIKKGGVRKFNR